MRFSLGTGLGLCAVASIGAMIAAAVVDRDASSRRAGTDPMTTASVPDPRELARDRLLAINHLNDASCILALHRIDGYDGHRVEPGAACADLDERLARIRVWRSSRRGDVTLADHRGAPLMTLMRGDGFAWEVIEPRDLHVSLAAY